MSDRDRSPDEILRVEDNPGDIRLTKEAFAEGSIANSLHVVTDGVELVWDRVTNRIDVLPTWEASSRVPTD